MFKRYLIFAFIAAGLNFLVMTGVKSIIEHICVWQHIEISDFLQKLINLFAKFSGIGSGFILKYVLDKKYVFDYQPESKKEEVKKVSLYALMSVFTTLFLIGFSELYEYFFQDKYAVYVGWAIGLVLGYSIKFILDSRFVFKTHEA